MYADTNTALSFFERLHAIYGPARVGVSPILTADGNARITNKEAIRERWAEHFPNVLNRPSNINEESIDNLVQIPINTALDEVSTFLETSEAIRSLFFNKAPSADSIPAGIHVYGGEMLIEKLTELFSLIWSVGTIPQ